MAGISNQLPLRYLNIKNFGKLLEIFGNYQNPLGNAGDANHFRPQHARSKMFCNEIQNGDLQKKSVSENDMSEV